MRATILIFTLLVASFASTAPAIAQEGHPLKGSWVGTWGPSKLHDNDLLVVLSWDGKETEVDFGAHEDLYFRSVQRFNDAVQGRGEPAATGVDGVWSLATALAVSESAKTGRTVPVAIPGV